MYDEESDFWTKTKESVSEKFSTAKDRSVQYVGSKAFGLIDALKPSKKTLAAVFFGAAFLGAPATHGWNRLGEALDYISPEECQGSADVAACAYTTMYEGGKSIAHHVGRTVGFVSTQIDEYRATSSRHTMTGSQP